MADGFLPFTDYDECWCYSYAENPDDAGSFCTCEPYCGCGREVAE